MLDRGAQQRLAATSSVVTVVTSRGHQIVNLHRSSFRRSDRPRARRRAASCGPRSGTSGFPQRRPSVGCGGVDRRRRVVTVFVAALLTALATGLGALPLLFARASGRSALGLANAVASGVMLGASVSLVLEGVDRSRSAHRARRRGRGRLHRSSSRTSCTRRIASSRSARCAETTREGAADRRGDDGALRRRGRRCRCGVRRRRDARDPDRGRHRGPQHSGGARDQPRARPAGHVGSRRRPVEHLLEPSAAASRGAGVPLRRGVRRHPPAALGFAAGAMVWMVARSSSRRRSSRHLARAVAATAIAAFAAMLAFQRSCCSSGFATPERAVTPRLTPPDQWPSLERGSSFVAMIELATERKTAPITPRQREVVALIAAGCSNDEVGRGSGSPPGRRRRIATCFDRSSACAAAARFRSRSGSLTGEDPLSAGRRYVIAARLPR